MTEDEARQKWCPFSRVVQHNDDRPDDGPYNRVISNTGRMIEVPSGSHCIAGRCAVWRWGDYREGDSGYCGLMPD